MSVSSGTNEFESRLPQGPFPTRSSPDISIESLSVVSVEAGRQYTISDPSSKEAICSVSKEVLGHIPEAPPQPPLLGSTGLKLRVTSHSPLDKQLEKAIDKINLGKMAKGVSYIEEPSPHVMKTLDSSLNPVTKLEPQFYVRKEDVSQANAKAKTQSLDPNACRRCFQRAIQSSTKLLVQSKRMESSKAGKEMRELANFYFKKVERTKNLDDIISELNKMGGLFDDADRIFLQEVCKELSGLIEPPFDVNVPRYYSKDEVMSSLRMLLSNIPKEDSDSLDQIHEIMQRVRKADGLYISFNALEQALNDPDLFADLVRANPPYAYSLDLAARSTDSNVFSANLEKLRMDTSQESLFQQAYAFKHGNENAHELLAGAMAVHLGLDTFLVVKTEQTFQGAQLQSIQNPRGIASRWIKGEEFPYSLWIDWNLVKQELAVAKAKGEDITEIQKRFETKREQILNQGGIKSISKLFLLDMVFGSSDSHIRQYKKGEDGEFYNFDFARCLAPFPAHRNKGMCFFNLRSEFLDHPLMEEPLVTGSRFAEDLQAVKDQVLSWDIDKIESEWKEQGLIGDPAYFEERGQKMAALESDAALIRLPLTSENEIRSYCQKWGIEFPEGISELHVLKNAVLKLLSAQMETLKEECWSKVHPQTIQEWKTRVANLQNYYRNSEKPTLKAAWFAYYPETAPFVKALEVLDKSPGSALLVRKVPRNFELVDPLRKVDISATSRIKETPALGRFKEAVRVLGSLYKGTTRGMKPMKEVYLSEAILPQHFYKRESYALWEIWKESSSPDNFAAWVDQLEKGVAVPGSEKVSSQGLLLGKRVMYMTEADRQKRVCAFGDKGASSPLEPILHTEDPDQHPHIFVMDEKQNFYVDRYDIGVINHSSFFSGKPVYFAGEFIFANGKLETITDKSGHYSIVDEENVVQMLLALQKRGIELDQVNFKLVDNRETFANAEEALKTFQKRLEEKKLGLRPLESIISDAKQSGLVDQETIVAMERTLSDIQKRAPSYMYNKTGTPG